MNVKIVIVLALFANTMTAKGQYHIEVIDSLLDGVIRFANIQSKVKPATSEDSKLFLKNVLKANENMDFYLRDIQTDDIGMTHEKYQQTYYGIRISGQTHEKSVKKFAFVA